MRRSRLILTLAFFFVAISAAGPIAFQIGKAAGRALRVDLVPGPFVVAAPQGGPGTGDFFDCDGRIRLPALRQFDRVQDCSPESRGRGAGKARPYAPARGPALAPRAGPVSRSLIRKIAEGPMTRGPAPRESPQLISDAGLGGAAGGGAPLEPIFPAFPGGAGFQGAPGAGYAGPAIPGGAGVPANLLAALDQGPNGKPPTFDPPPEFPTGTPEVPVPPSILLLVTGAAALRCAARRRRTAQPG